LTNFWNKSWLCLLVASASVSGCGSAQVQNSVVATPGANPTALLISPKTANVAIGQTQQFRASANFDNSNGLDVTGQVEWSSSNPALVTVGAATGLATAVLPGQVTITARSGNFSDTATVTVGAGITRVSVDSAGLQANNTAYACSISADGRFVAFDSDASNLVANDTNNSVDTFIHDRQTGATSLVSVDSAGNQASNNLIIFGLPKISGDGRFVAFGSAASDLVANDTNGTLDVFVHDRQTAVTTRVSVDSAGVEGNGFSGVPSISADGRFVAFESLASNLVANDSNGTRDAFVHDRQTGSTTRVSVDSAGVQANSSSTSPSLSSEGRFVAFSSGASNLVANDINGTNDVFVHDRLTGTTTRVSVGSDSVQANGSSGGASISADGRLIAFSSVATDLVGTSDTNGVRDVFVHDRQTALTTRVSVNSAGAQGNGLSYSSKSSISADGRFVAFQSAASNLVANDTNGSEDVFLHDRQTGTTARVSLDSAALQANGSSSVPSISADGRIVAFLSLASNLVANDSNGFMDVFVSNR